MKMAHWTARQLFQLAIVCWLTGSYAQPAFLEQQLPLKITVTTPIQLMSSGNNSVKLSDDQTLTAVFSRPVQALGSGFGTSTTPDQTPFRFVGCNVPGKFRWATTFIARFDADIPWPPDLDCMLVWNNIKAYDGASLQIPMPGKVKLVTAPLTASLSEVISLKAQALTDGAWSATVGAAGDKLPEVPPDGIISLQFSYPVDLSLIASVLKVYEGDGKVLKQTNIGLKAGNCTVAQPIIYEVPALQAGASTMFKIIPVPSKPSPGCVQVNLTAQLKPDTWYQLCIPAGSTYHQYAGKPKKAVCAQFAGLRPFRIPLKTIKKSAGEGELVRYRRLDLWLPHGLSPSVKPSDFASVIKLCKVTSSSCLPVPFTPSRPNKGTLRLTVPSLAPSTTYRLTIAASTNIKDGYGQPLKASSSEFTTGRVAFPITGIETNTRIVTLEADIPETKSLSWPYLAYGKDPTLNRAAFWSAKPKGRFGTVLSKVVDMSNYAVTALNLRDVLGKPDGEVVVPSGSQLWESSLNLSTTTGPWAMHTCCSKQGTLDVSSDVLLLQLSSVMASVASLDNKLHLLVSSAGGPVAGVDVDLYFNPYQTTPSFAGSAKTGKDGTAVFTAQRSSQGDFIAVLKPAKSSPVVLPGISAVPFSDTPQYKAALVLDRKLVREGDTLQVSGIVRYFTRSKTSLPTSTKFSLQYPNPSPEAVDTSSQTGSILPTAGGDAAFAVAPGKPSGSAIIFGGTPGPTNAPSLITLPVDVDPEFGTFTAVINIPSPARFMEYNIALLASDNKPVEGMETFTVADPRPPTVDLKLDAPKWVTPSGTVELTVTTVSYLGDVVSGAPVGVQWTTDVAQGVINLTTNALGVAKGSLELGKLASAEPIPVFSQVSLTAEWIGPTRERVVKQASISVTSGRFTVDITRSLDTDIPGIKFGLAAVVTDNESGNTVRNVDVTTSLVAPAKGPAPSCALPPACSFKSGSGRYSTCTLALPCLGEFDLKACYKGSCSTSTTGRNATTWNDRPLSNHDGIKMKADKDNYTVGGVATLSFHLPRPAPAVMLVWGNQNAIKTKVLSNVPAGISDTSIPIDASALGGLSIRLVAHFARTKLPLPQVPISKTFDFNAPAALTSEASILVNKESTLSVSVKAPAVLEPGSSGNINVTVSGGEATRVTVLAVDQAILDLIPYPLPDLSGSLASRVFLLSQWVSLAKSWKWAGVVKAVLEKARQLLAKDPFLNPGDLLASDPNMRGGKVVLDTSDEDYLALNTFWLSVFPELAPGGVRLSKKRGAFAMPGAQSGLELMFSAAPAMSASDQKSVGGASGSNVRVQSKFVATPLFKVLTIKAGGVGSVTFKAPDNLGTFAVRAFATTGVSSKVGSAESKVVVRRKISLTPSLPRFVRTGDSFQAGVIVTVSSAAPEGTKVTVKAKLVGANNRARLVGSSMRTTTVASVSAPSEVRFQFRALAAAGNLVVQFSATDGAGGADAVQVLVPVAAAQEAVTLGTSFAVKATATNSSWQEGIELPGAVPGSGALSLTASVGYLAASQATFKQLLDGKPDLPEGYWAAAVSLFPAVLAGYKQKGDAATTAGIKLGLSWVGKLNNPQLGLLPFTPTAWFKPNRVDINLNSWASWLVSAWPKGSLDPSLEAAAPTWATLAASQLVKDAAEYRTATGQAWTDLELLAWVRLAVGSKWSPKGGNSNLVAADLSFGRLTSKFSTLSTMGQTLVALVLQKEGKGGDPRVAQISKALQSGLRTQGRTAYVAADLTGKNAAGLEEQALSLLLLTQANVQKTSPLVQKLAAYVAANNPPAPILYSILPSASPRPAAIAHLALTTYDRSSGNLLPNVKLTVTTGPTTLLSATFKKASAPPASSSTPWEKIPPSAKTLDFSATGSGEASVAAVMSFVPNKVLEFPTYRGLWVQRTYQAVQAGTGLPVGPPLAAVKLGSLLAVTVQVTSPDDIPDVEVRVLLPGGIEAVDPAVFTDAAAQQTCTEGDQSSSYRSVYSWWWWPVCPAQETRTQLVRFRYSQLTAGTHSIKFLAVAATPGVFLDPPTRAFATQQPELMGVTAGGKFEVCGGGDACTVKQAPPPPLPKSCPGGCSGNGACNISSGKCICDKDFSGKDCSAQTSK